MSDAEPTAAGYRPTTTHADWGTGHPRLLVASETDRFVHEIDCDVTHVGSDVAADLVLHGTDPLHATITHDPADEYVLGMVGRGDTSHGDDMTLRTGAHFTAGPWRLVYARDEFADHGRPYGGRNGGEGAHQRRQMRRPDYSQERTDSSPRHCELKAPDDTSGPEQLKAIRQSVLADASVDGVGDVAAGFQVVNDERAGVYEARIGGREVGGVTYNVIGDERIALLGVSVFREFRGQGVSTALIREVLDDVRASGRTVTNLCPVVASFIDQHPDYADVIDAENPGVYARVRGSRRP